VLEPGGAAQRPADDQKGEQESGQTGRRPSGALLGCCARIRAASRLPAREGAISYERSGDQVQHEILPDRLNLMRSAAVTAQVGDVSHWAPARNNDPRERAVTQKLRTRATAASCRRCRCRGPEQHLDSTPRPRPKIGQARHRSRTIATGRRTLKPQMTVATGALPRFGLTIVSRPTTPSCLHRLVANLRSPAVASVEGRGRALERPGGAYLLTAPVHYAERVGR
jgi:hypothetical protein